MRVSTLRDGWEPGPWKTFVDAISPKTATPASIVPEDSLLFGVDLDRDGTRELRFPMGYFGAETYANLIFAPDADGVPAGQHTLRLGKEAPVIEVAASLAPGTTTTLLLLPDLTTRLIPDPANQDDVVVANAALGSGATGVLLTDSKGQLLGTLADNLAFGAWTTAACPGDSRFAGADWDTDGKPDWQSSLPVLPGSVVLAIGTATNQAVVCVRGGWAGVIGHKVK